MSNGVPIPGEFPASDTEPKYQPPSTITPMPRLPNKPIDKAKGFGWAGFGTAIASILFWVVKEMGGLSATAMWLKNLSPLMGLAMALVFVVAGAVFFGLQILTEMRADRDSMWSIADGRDRRQTEIMNEQSSILAELRTVVAQNAVRLTSMERILRQHVPGVVPADETETGRHRRINGR